MDGVYPPVFKPAKTNLESIFSSGLRFSTFLRRRLSETWRNLTEHVTKQTVGVDFVSVSSYASNCLLQGKVILSTPKTFFSNPVSVKLTWPRVLSDKLGVSKGTSNGSSRKKSANKPAACELKFELFEGLPMTSPPISQFSVRNSISEESVCRLTVVNPSDKPLFIQLILLDDFLLADAANLSALMTSYSEEFLEAAQFPKNSNFLPKVYNF